MRYRFLNWRTAALLLAALILSACAVTNKDAWVELRSGAATTRTTVQIKGTVVRSDLEGGLYLIRSTEGTNYNPTNLPDAYRVDGQAIQATAQRRDDLVSIGMVGVIVDLVRIRAQSKGTLSIPGTVNYRERVALPPDAVVEVQLFDVSRQDVPSTVITEATLPTHGRDFRAVGQEPFWSLQIEKGKELRFTYALGERNASTPVPVPKIDMANGTIVYHAITEENDLRVVIKPIQCLDDMSGRSFEKTVTVMHNEQIYQGCGEAVEFK